MDDLALITPTSDRPFAFELCERWMARALAHFAGQVHWYVVDDGVEPARCTMGQTHIRRPVRDSSTESFLGNLSTALAIAREPKILFIEDDDWYAEDYLAVYSERLDQAEIVGEGRAKYYNVTNRKYLIWPNTEHASLCQTGIRRCVVEWLADYVGQTQTPYVDLPLWALGRAKHSWRLAPESRLCIGMKRLPGKSGITACHDGTTDWAAEDRTGDVLRSWIGPEDAALYLKLSALVV